MRAMRRFIFPNILYGASTAFAAITISAQAPAQPDWPRIEEEALRHFQALVRMNTTDPPGGERPAAEYLKHVLDREGIPTQLFALEPHRPNVVARLKGNGKKRPLLILGHTDTVNIDEKKWSFPPFSAARDGGYIYGRGTVDDKDNVTAALMAMLTLKRLNVPLDRDVIFLSEAGEEGTTRVGIQFMVNQHFPEIDAEYCFAEGGNVTREAGKVKYASVQTLEKIPHAVELVARGPSGHASVPLKTNAVVHLSEAIGKAAQWRVPIRLNETTRVYFERLASISGPESAARYRALLSNDPKISGPADDYLLEHEPRHASMIRTSISPTMIQAGYRLNVIPSEVRATLDVRMHPSDNPEAFLAELRKAINDPAVDVNFTSRDVRPGTGSARLDYEGFKVLEAAVKKHYDAVTLPTMSTGATDMAYLRAKGMQCYGIGPALDIEDGPKGFGAHSDQERIVESELYRFVRFHYDAVAELARAR
jgi:acetylornithine deacetylase/succinyl-diaminopimelate desuccinylase-like protein